MSNQIPRGEGEVTLEQLKDLRLGLSDAHAQTPGGIAWKLSEVMAFLTLEIADGNWCWWQYLIKSALADAIELERARQAGGGAP